MNIVFVSTECYPFANASSLGNIVYGIAKELESAGHNVKIFLPRYGSIDPTTFNIERISIDFKISLGFNTSLIPVSIFKGILPNTFISVFFVESQVHFSNSKEIYPSALPTNEPNIRNHFFSHAVAESMIKLNISPDIIHIFDPSISSLSKLVASKVKGSNKTKIFCTLSSLCNLISNDLTRKSFQDSLELFNKLILPSEGFKQELESDFYNLRLLAPSNQRNNLVSILHGVDSDLFNPEKDAEIAQNYSKNYFSAGKKKCREDLCETFEIDSSAQFPLFCSFLERDFEISVELIKNICSEINNINGLLLLFSEENKLKDLVNHTAQFKNIKIVTAPPSPTILKKAFSGCDFYISSSLTNADGNLLLTSMYYGCIPISFYSGGAKDVITDEENGFIFKSVSRESVFEALIRAINSYKNKDKWTRIVKQAMGVEINDSNVAKKYINCYEIATPGLFSSELSRAK